MLNEPFMQIHLGRGSKGFEEVLTAEAQDEFYKWESETMIAQLMRLCPPQLWPHASYNNSCPRPILINLRHETMLRELNAALNLSLTDIVSRWWSDKAAKFSKRMPLDLMEEALLQNEKDRGGPISWSRTYNADGTAQENLRITEINARFSFNAFMHAVFGHMALEDTGMASYGLVPATAPIKVIDGLFTLFRRDRPLHLLKGKEPGVDFYMFVEAVRRRTGSAPRVIGPEDLRLVINEASKTGYTLCALLKEPGCNFAPPVGSSIFLTNDGELVEEIFQVGLELHQSELVGLSLDMLREICTRCFNDLRTIFLVHDKRMLGIIKQELQNQVARGVLTQQHAEILDRGIADTYLPGSPEMRELLHRSKECPDIRQDFLLKAIRGGKGDGIVFGDEMTQEEWIAALHRQVSPGLDLEKSCVVQRRIISRRYDMVLKASGERVRYPLIGTYFTVNGAYLGLGGWRSSNDRICTVGNGGAWICSVIRREDHFERLS